MTLNVYCIAAAAFGLLMGYIFAWSTRRNEPNGTDIAGILGIVLGGTVLQFLDRLGGCEEKFALYLIGLVAGYVVYLILLKANYPHVRKAYEAKSMEPSPFFPWLVRGACNCNHPDKTGTTDGGAHKAGG